MKKWFFPRVDLAEIMDRYAIVEIKYHKAIQKAELGLEIKYLENLIIKSVGRNKFQEIILSPEYHNLYEANLETYDAINVAKKDKEGKILSAFQLDSINCKRTGAKRELSNKFLGEDIKEIKIGIDGQKI